MTERTHPVPPPIATSSLSAFNAIVPLGSREQLLPADFVEEEPYTIKCICDYQDDDGATIYCETCDTWQHIECFYHGNSAEASRDDFNHFCADCKPRALDRRKATERQRQQREDRMLHDHGDKKTKRPPAKSHKKKPKPSDVQTNGYHFDHESGPGIKNITSLESSTHTKKAKSSHRSHQSISSQAHKRSPSHNARNPTQNHPQNHPPSPAMSPPDLPDHFLFPIYSKQLYDLYDNDPGPQRLQTNSFANLNVTNDMSLWLRDPQKLREDAGVDDSRDVFQMVKPDFDFSGYRWPQLEVRSTEIDASDSVLRLRYLSVVEPLRQRDSLVGELKGFVGFQKDYYAEETEGFARLCHPAPFVFFHPHLPLYIDTRQEGSPCRYVRRSCRANTTLDTYITNKSEYHFCILTERSLNANEQITIPWDFRFKAEIKNRYLYLLGLSDEEHLAEPDVSALEYVELSDLISNVLSDYGGCACGLGPDCAFARFHRHYLGKLNTQSNGNRPKKARKSKSQISPTSTGHATNSRDVSEGRLEQYDGEDDSRSASGSTRSKPQSRDMTPFRHGSEGNGTLTDQISEREKRKLVDIERKFEMMDQAQPPRKKKRVSDGHSANGSTNTGIAGNSTQKTKHKSTPRQSIPNSSATQLNGTTVANSRPYKDAGTSRQSSYSPVDKASPAAAYPALSRHSSHHSTIHDKLVQTPVSIRKKYADTSTQTEPVSDAWYSPTCAPTPNKTIVPLGKRLLSNRHKLRAVREAKRAEQERIANVMEDVQKPIELVNSVSADQIVRTENPSIPGSSDKVPDEDSIGTTFSPSIVQSRLDEDVVMSGMPGPAIGPMPKPDPPPWPVSSSPTLMSIQSPPELKVLMPPAPTFANTPNVMPPTPNGTTAPSSVPGSIAQSPFGNVHFPTAFPPSIINSVAHNPSPVKKKLSLSDYKARMKKVPEAITKPSTDLETAGGHSSFQPSLTEDGKLPSVMEGSAIVESPSIEKVLDPIASAEAGIAELLPTSNGTM